MRRSPQLMVMGLALAAAAACSDSASTRLMAPGDEASASKSSGSKSGASSRTYTSSGGVTARTYEGNTSGGGNSSCSALGFGSNGTKVDGSSSQTIAGYRFTVSADKQSISFAPVAGTTPTSVVLAVVVKGGPGYNIFSYSGNVRLTDGGLTSPVNGGGNIPQISHYVVCFGPGPVTPIFTKKLDKVLTELVDAQGHMLPDPTYTGGAVTVPSGKIRWLYYSISYTLPAGVTGTITENETEVCNTMGATDVNQNGSGMISCSFDWGNASPVPTKSGTTYTWTGVKNSGQIILPIDIGHGGLICGERIFKNTATLTTSTGQTYTAVSYTTIKFPCEVKFTKRLARVLIIDAAGQMVDDPTYTGGAVTIPVGETRWLDYLVEYTLPAGVTGMVTENEAAVCNTLGAGVNQNGSGMITCSFNWGMAEPGPVVVSGTGTWSGVGGTGSILVPIDLSTGGLACGPRTLKNTATLKTSTGGTYTAVSSTPIVFRSSPGACP